MKIMILQSTNDTIGGIYYVNKFLGNEFHKLGYELRLISLRNLGVFDDVFYEPFLNSKVINEKDFWGVTRLKDIINSIKKRKFINALRLLKKRIVYKKKLKKDYNTLKKEIIKTAPDYIIVSHYELLQGIPPKFLSKTINHFHLSFDEVLSNKHCQKIFNKYKKRIYKFLWLSKATCQRAIEYGYKNSTFIYNPIRIESKEVANVLENKEVIYLGRIAPVKRINLILDIFNKVSKNNPEWKLKIYGIGDFIPYEKYLRNPNIKFMGSTTNPKEVLLKASININTSIIEGFPMAILEANECGVPTITFDNTESLKDVINTNINGIIIKQDDTKSFERELNNLLKNEKTLKIMASNCKKTNEKFSKEKIINQWITLFNNK